MYRVGGNMLTIDCLRRFCLVKSKSFAPPGRPRSSFNDVASRDCQAVELVDLSEMRKTNCSGKTRLVSHIQLESEV